MSEYSANIIDDSKQSIHALLWYVVFEDNSFMPIITNIGEEGTEEYIKKLTTDFDKLFGMCVDIETSDVVINRTNFTYFQGILGRVYDSVVSLDMFKTNTVACLLKYVELMKDIYIKHTGIEFNLKYTPACDAFISAYTPSFYALSIGDCDIKPSVSVVVNPSSFVENGNRCMQVWFDGTIYLKNTGINVPTVTPTIKPVGGLDNLHYSRINDVFNEAPRVYSIEIGVMKNITFVLSTSTTLKNELIRVHAPSIFQYSTTDARIIDHIKLLFHAKDIVDKETLSKKFDMLCDFIKIFSKDTDGILTQPNSSDEYEQIKQYILQSFSVNDCIGDKMKAADLFEEIVECTRLPIQHNDKLAFRNRLSKYLKKMGLMKKRFSDGFYYYGLKRKTVTTIDEMKNIIEYSEVVKRDNIKIKSYVDEKYAIPIIDKCAISNFAEQIKPYKSCTHNTIFETSDYAKHIIANVENEDLVNVVNIESTLKYKCLNLDVSYNKTDNDYSDVTTCNTSYGLYA